MKQTIFGTTFCACLIWSGFWFIGSALTGLLLVVCSAYCVKHISQKNTFRVFSLSKLMLIYFTWIVIVSFTSKVPTTSTLVASVLASLPITYLVATNIYFFEKIWKNLRVLLYFTAVIFGLWAIWQVMNHVGYGYAVGPLLDRNAFAALINLLWFPAAFLYLNPEFNNNKMKCFAIGFGLLIITIALFATTSRGGIATWLILQPFLLWATYRFTKSKTLVASLIFIAVSAYSFSSIFLKSDIADRNFQLAPAISSNNLSGDAAINARLLIWKSTLKIIEAHPIYGTGWGTFAGIYPAYRLAQENSTSGVTAHNDYIQFAAEGGVPALLINLALVIGLLLQLKRSMQQTSNASSFESTTLLLGVLAIYIQAAVNFIFVFAFMNILAGLYLARVAHLTEKSQAIKFFKLEQVRSSVKRLLAIFVLIIIAAPFVIRLIAQACLSGSQPGLDVLRTFNPDISAFKVAHFIDSIRPQEGMAQELILQSSERYLIENKNNSSISENFKLELLNETLERFELIRLRTANNPNIGVREVKLLMLYREFFENNSALNKANLILKDNLMADPYHANSMIMLARVNLLEGHKFVAIKLLQQFEQNVLTRRDQQLIRVEILRQLSAPMLIAELEAIEAELRSVYSESETGRPLLITANFYENIDTRLNKIASQINNQ